MTTSSIITETKLFANYGAMSPVYELTVTGTDESGLLICSNNIDDDFFFIDPSSVRSEKPTSGSPIGVYFNEMDAY